MLGEERAAEGGTAGTIVLEANIDYMTPQNFAYVTERLIEAGALDVFTIPVLMKKEGPAICSRFWRPPNRAEDLSRIVFAETTTIVFGGMPRSGPFWNDRSWW
jgi:uncharacterized protein (DUF111 family)